MGTVGLDLWIVVGCTALTLFYSVAQYTLRNPSRVKLEQSFASTGHEARLAYIDRHLDTLLLAGAMVRGLSHVGIVLGLLQALTADAVWKTDLYALVVSAVLIGTFGIGIPHAWAKYAGESTVAASWPVLVATPYVLWPAVKVMGWLDEFVRRLSGHREESHPKTTVLEQEILHARQRGPGRGRRRSPTRWR